MMQNYKTGFVSLRKWKWINVANLSLSLQPQHKITPPEGRDQFRFVNLPFCYMYCFCPVNSWLLAIFWPCSSIFEPLYSCRSESLRRSIIPWDVFFDWTITFDTQTWLDRGNFRGIPAKLFDFRFHVAFDFKLQTVADRIILSSSIGIFELKLWKVRFKHVI